MRKIPLIAILLVSIVGTMLLLCSCSNFRAIQLSNLTNEESKKIQPMSEEIIRCLTEKDKDAFIELFCEQVKNSDDFNAQIDQAFDYFVCDTYTNSEIKTSASGGQSTEKGERVEWYVIPEITYIKVVVVPDGDYDRICSRYYGVSYYWQIINKADTSLEGLQFLAIELLNTDNYVTIGTNEYNPRGGAR